MLFPNIVLASCSILYLELALIRFLPAHVMYLGYFTNFILLVSFLGIGLGFILGRYEKKLWLAAPFLLLLLGAATMSFSSGLNIKNDQIIFFRSAEDIQSAVLPSYLVLPLIFMLVSVTFACLSQLLALFFIKANQPLKAYLSDILGSITGIVLFYGLSSFGLPPFVWFAVFGVMYLYLIKPRLMQLVFLSFLLIVFLFLTIDVSEGKVIWSPYQKITLLYDDDKKVGNLLTNNIHHQFFSGLDYATRYLYLFDRIEAYAPLNDVLIIGAGTGQDVNVALHFHAQHIDAVEIDPKILEIGETYHPDRPYDDERVNTIVTDGRNFLKNTQRKYDIIIFALTDSIVLSSGYGQVRLESYLFTKDAFAEAKNHLKSNGIFVMYNDYRTEWLIKRLETMIASVFGKNQGVVNLGGTSRMFMARNGSTGSTLASSMSVPTDDWPFPYLKNHEIPQVYLFALAMVGLLSTLSVFGALKLRKADLQQSIPRLLTFFLLGAAFSLIESKSIVQLSLLFGSTWQVNAFAFIGILMAVLAAVIFTMKIKKYQVFIPIVMLLICLGIQYLLPLNAILFPDVWLRLAVAVLYFYLPVFFANLIFAKLFQATREVELDFASNMLGLIAGGMAEYLALIYGYSSLAVVAGIFYFGALLLVLRYKKTLD